MKKENGSAIINWILAIVIISTLIVVSIFLISKPEEIKPNNTTSNYTREAVNVENKI